jgi:hypothetical protein
MSLLIFDKYIIDPLEKGTQIRVANQFERFHARICEVLEDGFNIKIIQTLFYPVGYTMGDVIYCKKENIMQVVV